MSLPLHTTLCIPRLTSKCSCALTSEERGCVESSGVRIGARWFSSHRVHVHLPAEGPVNKTRGLLPAHRMQNALICEAAEAESCFRFHMCTRRIASPGRAKAAHRFGKKLHSRVIQNSLGAANCKPQARCCHIWMNWPSCILRCIDLRYLEFDFFFSLNSHISLHFEEKKDKRKKKTQKSIKKDPFKTDFPFKVQERKSPKSLEVKGLGLKCLSKKDHLNTNEANMPFDKKMYVFNL